MLREQERKQITLPEKRLERGLAYPDFPGEPVAYVRAPAEIIASRMKATLQHSFDNLDELDFALFDLGSGLRAAVMHHAGLPRDETEVYIDHAVWKRANVLEDVLRGLSVSPHEVVWRQEWPASALGG